MNPLKKIYFFFEDKWYSAMDKLDSKLHVYKILDPIDKVVPSFILFLLALLFLIILGGYFIQFSSDYEVTFLTLDSVSKDPLQGVRLYGTINEIDFDETTNSEGKAVVPLSGVQRNTYETLLAMLFTGQEAATGTFSAEKSGYTSITDQQISIEGRQQQVLLQALTTPPGDQFPDSVEVTLVDESSGEVIIDDTAQAYVKFKCNNKNISSKTVLDAADGSTDGTFTLNEENCEFFLKGVYSTGYEPQSNLSLPNDTTQHTIALTRLSAPPTTGRAKVKVFEKNSSPKKYIAGVTVSFYNAGEEEQTPNVRTGSDGSFASKELSPGTYKLSLTSPDGNYYSVNLDANLSIEVTADGVTEREYQMEKMDPNDARLLRIKVIDSNNSAQVQGAELFVQSLDINNFATNKTGTCSNGCKTDINGLIAVTGLSVRDAGKLVASIYKEGYLFKIISPTLYKLSEGPETISITLATPSNSGSAQIRVKSTVGQRPLVDAKTYLYTDSVSLNVKRILYPKSLPTAGGGQADYNFLPEGKYSAKASFGSASSLLSATKDLVIGTASSQIVSFDLNIDTNSSIVELRLVDANTGASIISAATVKVFSLNADYTALTELEKISKNSANAYVSNGYEQTKRLFITIEVPAYAPNFVNLNYLAEGVNPIKVKMHSAAMDGNVKISFDGLYGNNNFWGGEEAYYIAKDSNYYARFDVVISKPISFTKLLSLIRVSGSAGTNLRGIDFYTPKAFSNNTISCSTDAYKKVSGVNDDNYYFPTTSMCPTAAVKDQGAVSWGGADLNAGTYYFVARINIPSTAANDSEVKLQFSAKETHGAGISSETPLYSKSFFVEQAQCNFETTPNCPKIYFRISLNGQSISPASFNYSVAGGKKMFVYNVSPGYKTLLSGSENKLALTLYNNSPTAFTGVDLQAYSYAGARSTFNLEGSGYLFFDSAKTENEYTFNQIASLRSKERSSEQLLSIYPAKFNTSNYLVLVASAGGEDYYLFLETRAPGESLLLNAEFLAGVYNQNLFGDVTALGAPIDLLSASITAWNDCGGRITPATNAQGIQLGVLDNATLVGSTFEIMVPGTYTRADCVKVSVSPKDTGFEPLVDKIIYASSGGTFDPALACIDVKTTAGESNDVSLQWGNAIGVNITNRCSRSAIIQINSGLLCSGSNCASLEGAPSAAATTIASGATESFTLIGQNKGYSGSKSFSDLLGFFPVLVKAKFSGASSRMFAIADRINIHLSNPSECFIISQDVFDFVNDADKKIPFDITNECQYTLFDSYYIPKASLRSFGLDLNEGVPKYGQIDFNWQYKMRGTDFRVDYTDTLHTAYSDVISVAINTTPTPILSADGRYKTYRNLEADFSEEDNNVLRLKVTWTDLVSDENVFGLALSGPLEIKYSDGSTRFIYPDVNFSLDPLKCVCNGTPSDIPTCETGPASNKNTCEYIITEENETEEYMTGRLDFSIPNGKIDSILFNVDADINLDNLSLNITPKIQYSTIEPVIVYTGTNSGFAFGNEHFTIFPNEDITYILGQVSLNSNLPIISLKEKYCKLRLNKMAWINSDEVIYWAEKVFADYSWAKKICENGKYNLLGKNGTLANVADSESITPDWPDNLGMDFSWADGFWTSHCNPNETACSAIRKKASGDFNYVHWIPATATSPALPSVFYPTGRSPFCRFDANSILTAVITDKECANLIEGHRTNPFLSENFLNHINPRIEEIVKKVYNNGSEVSPGTVVVWVEGQYLKARFVGENFENFDNEEINYTLKSLNDSGIQYGIINIKDYVNNNYLKNN